jgi:hypothetical protein
VNALDINLYDLSVRILRERGIWDQVIEQEAGFSKDELKELLQMYSIQSSTWFQKSRSCLGP